MGHAKFMHAGPPVSLKFGGLQTIISRGPNLYIEAGKVIVKDPRLDHQVLTIQFNNLHSIPQHPNN